MSTRIETIPVLVEGIARSFGSLWEFQKVLLADPHFGRVAPERLNRGEQKEVVFQMRFEYYPDRDVAPVAGTPEEGAVQTVSDPGPAVEPLPADDKPAAELPAAEPPRRKLPTAVDDGSGEDSGP